MQRGEIVGIAGVEGNGQSELVEAILAPSNPKHRLSGTIEVLGQNVLGWSTRSIRQLGVAMIPDDRHAQGLLLSESLEDNFLLGMQRSPEFSRHGMLRLDQLANVAANAIATHGVRPPTLDLPAHALSGGNQQKLIVAREFQRSPGLLIACQPTRGVDVGAIEFIHSQIIQARDSGAGVLLISSELDEILKLSDRILVMFQGRIAAEFPGKTVSERELGIKMGGG
jgi:simple sugar transport system ATP-binding protein